ncbi:MAG: archease [Armatimonadota bacterium]|nr:archease [Armatimonadota bacterium]MDW8142580.1 archease [Armatimonadota bacterium]
MGRDFTPFEVIDHTADVGIIAYGRDFRELLENAALGMFNLMADLATVAPKKQRQVIAEAPVPEREWLLLRWLKELHYLKESEKFIPCDASVIEVTETMVVGVVKGEELHDGITLLHHIKAVTHHMVSIEQVGDLLKAQVIFDI